jgi:tRNA U34 5-methylaminomethyl-2-thiouridine-forming methyltransferase MnmC
MHPGTGPGVEPQELYVEPSRLRERLLRGDGGDGGHLVLLDVGLGAASNAITAWRVSEALPRSARRLEIVSFENDLSALRLALEPEHAESFGLTGGETDAHAAASALLAHGRHETDRTVWRLCLGDFPERIAGEPSASADVVFWDFYSAKTHPHLWSVSTLLALRAVCRDGATLHTYSTATSFRAGLLLAGFAVGVGGRTGDRAETTIAASNVQDLEEPLDARWLTRLARSTAAFPADVPNDEDGRAEALARVRACPQFSLPPT